MDVYPKNITADSFKDLVHIISANCIMDIKLKIDFAE